MSDESKSGLPDSENVSLKSSFSHRISRDQIKKRCGDLIDSLPIVIYVAEPSPPYSPIYVSKQIEILGYTQEEWHTSSDLWISIIHEDDRERVLQETEKAIEEMRENEYEYRLQARDGSIFWFYDKGNFVRDEDGKAIVWEGFLLDITQRKKDEQISLTAISNGVESYSSKAILLVEDEEIIREMVRHILLANGYEVVTASDGLEALKICEQGDRNFDLIITDFNMPGMNGHIMAEKINELRGEQKFLYISGYSDDPGFLRSVSESEKNFIAKPFSPETLLTKINEMLEEN